MEKYNFHTHTKRCGHASGKDEEYVKEAVSCAFSVLSFSDHMMFPYLNQRGIRGNYVDDFDDYLNSVNFLRKKYKDKIEIHVGFEAEYCLYFEQYYKSLFSSKQIEYLLLGQHFHFTNDLSCLDYNEFKDGAMRYVDDVILGMKSGLFLYVAHPDMLVYFYDERDDYYKTICRKLIKASIKYDVPLELNVSKVENGRLANVKHYIEIAPFPDETFWQIVGEENAKVVIGLDAHSPVNVNEVGFDYGLELAKKYNLNILNKDEIILRMKKIQANFSH